MKYDAKIFAGAILVIAIFASLSLYSNYYTSPVPTLPSSFEEDQQVPDVIDIDLNIDRIVDTKYRIVSNLVGDNSSRDPFVSSNSIVEPHTKELTFADKARIKINSVVIIIYEVWAVGNNYYMIATIDNTTTNLSPGDMHITPSGVAVIVKSIGINEVRIKLAYQGYTKIKIFVR